MKHLISLSVCSLLALSTFAATILVPSDQPTIQAGIDSALSRDTVLVATGTYTGPGNTDIDAYDKSLVIKSKLGANLFVSYMYEDNKETFP